MQTINSDVDMTPEQQIALVRAIIDAIMVQGIDLDEPKGTGICE